VQATIFPHDAEGVSLWFSGKRLLTDGTSENAQKAKFAEFLFSDACSRRIWLLLFWHPN
jgi:hypothetical protein